MRPGHRLLASCAVLAVLAAAPAAAADYDPPIFVEEAPEWVPVEVGSGWYLRGDIGYAVKASRGSRYSYRSFDPGPPIAYDEDFFDTARLSGDLTYGIGAGYHFNDWLRADLTLERLEASFAGARTDFPALGWSTIDSSSMTAYSAMLNGYVDLGTVVGVTPYAGAGVGYSYVKWDDLSSRYYDNLGAFAGNGPRAAASDEWRFTYALMAGLAYDLTENVKLDFGYKYRRISGGDMFQWSAADAALGATGAQGRDGGLSQHEIKVGLRYDLW